MQLSSHRTAINPARAMSLDEVRRVAPSIFTESAHEKMSQRYTLIPTGRVLEALQSEGFVPTRVMQARKREYGAETYAKHLVRLRHVDFLDRPAAVDAIVPEVVLINSHDGSTSYQLHAGLHRYVCSNGMVVANGCVGSLSIRHTGDVVKEVIEGAYEIISETPKIMERVEHFRHVSVASDEAVLLAELALELKYGDGPSPILADQLLRPHRAEDNGSDLWSRLNVMQENLLRGGLTGYASTSRRRVRTRAVTSVGEDVRLNKALWRLADRFAELKGAH